MQDSVSMYTESPAVEVSSRVGHVRKRVLAVYCKAVAVRQSFSHLTWNGLY